MGARNRSSQGGAGAWRREPQRLVLKDVAAAAGISPAKLRHLVQLGLVSPTSSESSDFSESAVARLKRMLRLHAALGVSLTSAAIIADLLERLERMEWELDRFRKAWDLSAGPARPAEMWLSEVDPDDSTG